MISLEINDRAIEVESDTTILEASEIAGVKIPTLCHLKGLFPSGACRLCIVEVEGRTGLLPSCSFPVQDGMKVFTQTPKVLNARQTIVELLLASHPFECLTCNRSMHCELQDLAADFSLSDVTYRGKSRQHYSDFSSPSIVRNPDKCILCGRCVRVCEEVQNVSAIDFTNRGFDTMVLPPFEWDLSETDCVNCGQCILACPTGALHENSSVDAVVEALLDGKKYLVAQAAPAIRVSLGEFYGCAPGENVTGRIAAALRRIGFKKVFDTDFTADLTIMEEGTELVERLKSGEKLPMFTSCCPGWVKFAEHNFPDMLDNISTCRSPQAMMGSLVKSHLSEQEAIAPEDIFVVSIMPCTAKKFEATRPELSRNGIPDVDAVLTTREFARLIDRFGVEFNSIKEGSFDTVLGTTSGSGDIFAASGGVMESALRSAYKLITGDDLAEIELTAVRGFDGLKEAKVTIAGKEVSVAVVNTLLQARKLVDRVRSGEASYDFVEVMACPGGCVGGGGQMYGHDDERIKKRIASIYNLDRERRVRLSYKNEQINELYSTYLEKPGSHKSHELLHTVYSARGREE
jgi:iron-only hydrogenase group A